MGQVSMIEDIQSRMCDDLFKYAWPIHRDDSSKRISEEEFKKVILRISEQAFSKFEKFSVDDETSVELGLSLEKKISDLESETISFEHGKRIAEEKLLERDAELQSFVAKAKQDIAAFKERFKTACTAKFRFEIEKRDRKIRLLERERVSLQNRLLSRGGTAISEKEENLFEAQMKSQGVRKR